MKDTSVRTLGLIAVLLSSLFVVAIAGCTWHVLAWARLPWLGRRIVPWATAF